MDGSTPTTPQDEVAFDAEHFMSRSFFIYDHALERNDEDPPEEVVVYFYPPQVDLQHQLFLIGAIDSMINFSKNFTQSPPKVMSMEREKMAFKQIGNYILVLTGSLNQPDSALYLDLEKIFGAFEFLYGSFEIIMKNVGDDRLKFLEVMKELGKDLIPFIRQYENEAHPSFDKIPFANLPGGFNRLFLSASEILSAMRSEPDNLGGCILYNGSVLCTHLERSTTSYILTLLEPMTQKQEQKLQIQNLSSKQSKHTSQLGDGDVGIPVFLGKEELEKLREGKPPGIGMKGDFKNQFPELGTIGDKGEFVGLYTLFLPKVAIAIIMNLPAMYDVRHINKTRSVAHHRLYLLEQKLQKIPKAEIPNPGFNFLAFDKGSKTVTGSSLDMSFEPDVKFHIATRIQHEIFTSNPQTTHIMLRDYSGVVLGRKNFENEVYFQHRAPPAIASSVKTPLLNKDIVRLEEAAREGLQDLSISLI